MATDKRARQREARLDKLELNARSAKRQQRGRLARNLAILVALIVGVAALISLLGGDDDEVATDASTSTTSTTVAYSDPELAEEVLAREPPKPEGAPLDLAKDALEVVTLIEGQGDPVVAGDTVVVHYVGVLPSGGEFDESWSRGSPLTTPIPGNAIAGWNEGLIGAKIGERRRLVVGSEKAYGPTGSATIPPDTPLAFEIDVVDIVRAGS